MTNFISILLISILLIKASLAFSKLPVLLDSLSTTAPARASAAAAADADPAQQVPMTHPSGVVPVVSLVVVKVELGCEIDLNLLARSAPNTEYRERMLAMAMQRQRRSVPPSAATVANCHP